MRSDASIAAGPGAAALAKGLKALFVMGAAGVAAVLAWQLLFGGLFTVGPHESVIVLRFGKIADIHTSGIHWAMPYPVDTLIRIPTSSQRLLRVGSDDFWFRPERPADDFATSYQGGPLVPGLDGYLLTGDANIIHTAWALEFHVSSPQRYFETLLGSEEHPLPSAAAPGFTEANPVPPKTAALLRDVLDRAVVSATATEKVDRTLYGDSAAYVEEVRRKVAEGLALLDVGLAADNVILQRKSPPFDTVAAFAAVAMAENEQDRIREESRGLQIKMLEAARSEASKILGEAEAYRKKVVSEIESEKSYFQSVSAQVSGQSKAVLVALYAETLADSLSKTESKYVLRRGSDGRRELRLLLSGPGAAAPSPETTPKGRTAP